MGKLDKPFDRSRGPGASRSGRMQSATLAAHATDSLRRVAERPVNKASRLDATAALRPLLDEPIGLRNKAFPPGLADVRIRDVGSRGLNLLAGDLLLPTLTLRADALAHNLSLMARWCRDRGVSLAPHGKTTMAPQLFHRQLELGAWGITAANVNQAALMHAYGIRRVLIANEVADSAARSWIATVLDSDPTFELSCLVDSMKVAADLDALLSTNPARPPLPVLIELAAPRRRGGVRSDAQAEAIAALVDGTSGLRLIGVECFEGVIGPGRGPEALRDVDALLERVCDVARHLDSLGYFALLDEVLISAGGSVFFDRVAEVLSALRLSRPGRVVLRSGCYITHDSRAYDELSPLGSIYGDTSERLRPALELWSAVLSRPEPELAILGFGKRDAPHDIYLPTPQRIVSATGESIPLPGGVEVRALNDQHAYLRVPQELPLSVGDRVVCGISHPCTAFDKWSLIPVVNERYDVVEAVRTLF